ncbi:hypothetical protein ES288_A11G190400v1 [Gossypium darwinii]|uniref:Uncharacterized protein n=1 Tax=Gossypium darwinii TaxID=34276 RepID=A0A5D2ENJ2_GOSDA|nr:hypothetical protein ES288_A11G190400v1 [Gossypium darwinii]
MLWGFNTHHRRRFTVPNGEGSGHGVDPGMGMDGGVCDGAGGRQHGRVGVVLVADSMGKWEEASGSLGFWDWAWMLG